MRRSSRPRKTMVRYTPHPPEEGQHPDDPGTRTSTSQQRSSSCDTTSSSPGQPHRRVLMMMMMMTGTELKMNIRESHTMFQL